mmetsp:Transcript_18620/g.31790  ORF Transcript_18620/g.31790 Transcript_18620/m.31790 type:complete len:262 (-) Transcript_18620:18-803(-)
MWPANKSDDWCPPGTSIVRLRKGSLHTCSDKICRWNVLGLQGALLSSVLTEPLYMTTLTVGRKFTSCICRRAICCRAIPKPNNNNETEATTTRYMLHHPAVMGTGVYMDESGSLDMSNSTQFGKDVQFHDPSCWVWWPDLPKESGGSSLAECIDGNTGFAQSNNNNCYYYEKEGTTEEERSSNAVVSRVSTTQLLLLFSNHNNKTTNTIPKTADHNNNNNSRVHLSLPQLKEFKLNVSQDYEQAKQDLHASHRIFRQWIRR